MNLFVWEFKKIFKQRSSLVALGLAFALCLFFGIYQGTVSLTYRESPDTPREYGPALAKKEQALIEPWRGPMTAEVIKAARDQFALGYQPENLLADGTLEPQVRSAYIRPIGMMMNNVDAILSKVGSNYNTYAEYINAVISYTDEEIEGFYEARDAYVENRLREKLDNEQDIQYFLALNEKVETPFYYDWTRGQEYYADTVGSILTVVGWLLCIAFAPVFAGEYQCGAASVVLCTRKGRGKAAAAKCLAVLAVTVLWWALCCGVYVGCQVLLLGTRGLNCPVQAGFFVSSFLPMTVWESELYALVLALVSCLAAVSVTAFFSARMNSTFPAIVCSLGVVLFLPMLGSFLKIEAVQKVLALLPLAKDYSVLFNTQTFHLFGRVLWMPVVLLVVLPLYMVVFLPLAGRIYTRHQVR